MKNVFNRAPLWSCQQSSPVSDTRVVLTDNLSWPTNDFVLFSLDDWHLANTVPVWSIFSPAPNRVFLLRFYFGRPFTEANGVIRGNNERALTTAVGSLMGAPPVTFQLRCCSWREALSRTPYIRPVIHNSKRINPSCFLFLQSNITSGVTQ